MKRLQRRKTSQAGKPSTHTGIIDSVAGMWSKLAWDIDSFHDIQRLYPSEKQPLAYSAINVCIAAWSLAQWVESAHAKAVRSANGKANREKLRSDMYLAVPSQRICEAIANTAKHAHLSEEDWPRGSVTIEWHEGDEDVPPGWTLYHQGAGVPGISAFNVFFALRHDWAAYLRELGLLTEEESRMEWEQNKLRAIFGDVSAISNL